MIIEIKGSGLLKTEAARTITMLRTIEIIGSRLSWNDYEI
jgi:hypothetical protein